MAYEGSNTRVFCEMTGSGDPEIEAHKICNAPAEVFIWNLQSNAQQIDIGQSRIKFAGAKYLRCDYCMQWLIECRINKL